MRVMDGRTDGRQEVAVLMVLVVLEAEVPGAGERPQALFTQVKLPKLRAIPTFKKDEIALSREARRK